MSNPLAQTLFGNHKSFTKDETIGLVQLAFPMPREDFTWLKCACGRGPARSAL